MSYLRGQGGGMVGGGAGGCRGGGRGGRGGRGHGGSDDEEARKALIRSVGARKRAARRYLIQGGRLPPSLADYAPGGRYFNHLPPLGRGRYFNHLPPLGRGNGGHAAPPPGVVGAQPPPAAVHKHLFAHDDAEEALYIAQATAASEASIAEMRRRDAEEIAAQMAAHRPREERERAAKRARMVGAGASYAVHSEDLE